MLTAFVLEEEDNDADCVVCCCCRCCCGGGVPSLEMVRIDRSPLALVELDGGALIDCTPVNVSAPGERTRVSIRPERVEYNKDRLQKGVHTLKAEVLEFIYMGDIFRTRLRVAGNDEFIIKTRNAPDQARLQPGQEIEIGWLPQDCRALDA